MNQFQRTVTAKGVRYYINGKQVSKGYYQQRQFYKALHSFHTTIKGGVVRHYCVG